MTLTAFAPAKINLYLHVVGRRADGYHLLDSIAIFAGIGDRLSAEPDAGLSLTVTGPFAAGLDAEADNLVLRAARTLATEAGVTPSGRILLEKNVPVASGIGGGSADAAAALRLLCRLWKLDPRRISLAEVAGALGADVPVCLASKPMRMSGIGEVLSPAPVLPDFGIVLINPGVAVSTPAVFRARTGGFSAPAVLPDGRGLIAALRDLRNDLEVPALELAPAIGDVLRSLAADPACLLARMSGSGATCFGLYKTADVAKAAASVLARDGWWAWGGPLWNCANPVTVEI